MKNFALICRDDAFSLNLQAELCQKLTAAGLVEDVNHPDLVVAIGGDGTFLRSVHQYIDQLATINFIGLRTGTLGFYTDYNINQLDLMIDDLINKVPSEICKMPLIQADTGDYTYYALNEIRLENNIKTLVIDVAIDDKFLEKYRGNGMSICTPTGSTAYNRSLGGPIIDHRAKVMTMTEIAGIHHNSYRALDCSLVLDASRVITLEVDSECCNVLGVDHLIFDNFCCKKVKIKFSDKEVRVIRYKKNSFVDRIRKTLVIEN